jgi:hypothetical protein
MLLKECCLRLRKLAIGNFLEPNRESAGRGNRKGGRCNSDMLIRVLTRVYGHSLLSNKLNDLPCINLQINTYSFKEVQYEKKKSLFYCYLSLGACV